MENDKQKMIDESAKMIKELAADQKIQVKLSEEQYAALEEHWHNWDPKKPAQLTFIVDGKERADIKVAAYTYRGDTCCV
ncbi:hypothetical protein AB9P05_18555 [Roseivirga sp. BDSF3-8]|uniref:hypothetical protein n=1 Tax=Roseivirga sp. BDSF3-8 TaxID=3241598 RepID=UPI00353262AC